MVGTLRALPTLRLISPPRSKNNVSNVSCDSKFVWMMSLCAMDLEGYQVVHLAHPLGVVAPLAVTQIERVSRCCRAFG